MAIPVTAETERTEPIRCGLEMTSDGEIVITLYAGCCLPDAVDLCRTVVGRDDLVRRLVVRPARST
ncbi:MAG: hypothetical protein ACREX8_06480 [Gammaproteobacteria bacterium]